MGGVAEYQAGLTGPHPVPAQRVDPDAVALQVTRHDRVIARKAPPKAGEGHQNVEPGRHPVNPCAG